MNSDSSGSFLIQVNIQSTQRHPETPTNVAGFHFPSKVRVGRSCQLSGRRAVRNVFSLCVCVFRNLRTARTSNRRRRKRRRRRRPTATSSTASSSGGSRCRPSTMSCWVYWWGKKHGSLWFDRRLFWDGSFKIISFCRLIFASFPHNVKLF